VAYGGYEFRIVTPRNGSYDNLISLESDAEQESGETLPDAIYKRNRIIEERYDIKFNQITLEDYDACLQRFTRSTKSDSDDFDLCMLLPRYAWAQSLEGAIVKTADLPYLDISQPWYIKSVNDEMSIGGKLFFAYSNECLNLLENTSCILFNKKLVENLALENLYNLVKEGKWTIDKFFALARAGTADLDGDGLMTENDQYGILSYPSEFLPNFLSSSGVRTVGKDENDLHIFVGQNEKLYDIMGKVCDNLYSGQKIYFDGYFDQSSAFGSDLVAISVNQFAAGHGLFISNCLRAVPALRAMETDFGILPFPKYDEAQAQYYSRTGRGWINSVPVTAPDLSRTSVVMEALAVESKNLTIPAYYEVALRTKFLRDDESEEMLLIIENHRFVDVGDNIYGDIVIGDMLNGIIQNKNVDFVSAIEKNIGKIEEAIRKSNEAALALD